MAEDDNYWLDQIEILSKIVWPPNPYLSKAYIERCRWDDYIPTAIGPTRNDSGVKALIKEGKISCYHNWKNYVGLTDSFEYCEICEQRRNG